MAGCISPCNICNLLLLSLYLQLYNNEDRLNPGLAFNRPDGLQLQPTYSYLSTGTAPASVTPSQVILVSLHTWRKGSQHCSQPPLLATP
jgi:hypothetical protein